MSCPPCPRKGPITNNGFLNFMREFRKNNCGLSPKDMMRQGACAWNRLSCAQKACYKRMGCPKRRRPKCPKRRRRPKCPKRRRRPRCPRKRKRRCPPRRRRKPKRRCPRRKPKRRCGRRKRCMKPGPLTNNGYLNFLRWYRKKYCIQNPIEAIRRGARRWCKLPQHKKDRFNRMACKVTKNKRRLNSPICRRC